MDHIHRTLSNLPHLDLQDDIVDKHEHVQVYASATCNVYVARLKNHNKKVAVKEIRVFLKDDRSFAKRLAEEIRIWQSLQHHNVLPLLGYYISGDNRPNLVSEWMEKGTLFVFMKTLPPCSKETCEMLLGMGSGLAYLHSRGVVHGDLKSHNILVSSMGAPLLTDFGLSQAMEQSGSLRSMTLTSSNLKSSLRWMAPELLLFITADRNEATDIWGVGMVALELLSWEVPYADKKNDRMVFKALSDGELPVKPARRGDPEIFDLVWRFCLACWETDPRLRPTADEVVNVWFRNDEANKCIPNENSQAAVYGDSLYAVPLAGSEAVDPFRSQSNNMGHLSPHPTP